MDERFLFRGKRKDNGELVEGYLYITHDGKYEIAKYCDETNIERIAYEVIPKTVGQCTGLEDKNGKLIFEGDILEFVNDDGESSFYVVIWDTSLLSWQVQEISHYIKNDYYGFDELCEFGDTEVIGNVYDNPELLQRSDKE